MLELVVEDWGGRVRWGLVIEKGGCWDCGDCWDVGIQSHRGDSDGAREWGNKLARASRFVFAALIAIQVARELGQAAEGV